MSNAVLSRAAAKTTSKTAAPKPRSISAKAATTHVHKNLIRHPKSPHKGAEPWSGLCLDALEDFITDVKRHLGNVSNLSGKTLDAANYEELLGSFRELSGWKPKRKAIIRKNSPAVAAATKALKEIHVEERPAPRRRRQAVAVAVTVPPVRVSAKVVEKAPKVSAEDRIVPANWRYMAEHAEGPDGPNGRLTMIARAWWTEHCNKRMRGEV